MKKYRAVWLARLNIAALCVFALAGCGDEGEAKTAVKSLLNDPDSAQFSELKRGKSKGDICGVVNAKNRMGGYVGNTPFMYEKNLEMASIVTAPEDRDFRSIWLGMRTDSYAEEFIKVMSQCQALERWDSVCATPHPQPKHQMCNVLLGDPKDIYHKLKAAYDR